MIVYRVIAGLSLCLALSGCLYGDPEMLASLPDADQCPFTDNTAYTAYTVEGNERGEVIGQFTFVNDANTGHCEVTQALQVTQAGSGVLENILASQNKIIDSGVYVSWTANGVPGDVPVTLATHYSDGYIEIRGTCDGVDPNQTLTIPGVPKEEGGDCHLTTEEHVRAFAEGSEAVKIDYLFEPNS